MIYLEGNGYYLTWKVAPNYVLSTRLARQEVPRLCQGKASLLLLLILTNY